MEDGFKTGIIIPRDYGMAIKSGSDRIFISPLKYALGGLILEDNNSLDNKLRVYAGRNGYGEDEFVAEFMNSLKRKRFDKKLFDLDYRSVVGNVSEYSRSFFAQVASKSDADYIHEVQLGFNETGCGDVVYSSSRCDCRDSFWMDFKRRSSMCPHLSALEIALNFDSKSRLSSKENITGLKPSQRQGFANLPFNLFERGSGQMYIELLVDYFLESKSMYEVDRKALELTELYADSLEKIISNSDSAEFTVIRQQEQRSSANESQKRIAGATRALNKRIVGMLKKRGFRFEGYGLEFKGSNYESVSQRYKQGNVVYSISTQEDFPPIIVKKMLGEKLTNIHSKDDDYRHPLIRTSNYECVDDSTRREALTKVIIPDSQTRSEIFVPKILKERYKLN